MPLLNAHLEETSAPGEVRAALERVAASEAFRGSPQLVAFLRYVVEATLRGEQDRIKGYTIAVEALGRGDDFDPQDDPIVRVEATRLRRAIHRYYENGGRDDAVQIDLPLGSYVPVFRRAALRPAPVVRLERAGGQRASRARWSHIGLLLLGAGIYAALDFVFDFTPGPRPVPLFLATQSRAAAALRASATPAVFVGPFYATARSGTKPETDALRGKLRDALARFDELQVIAGAPGDARGAFDPQGPSRYVLTATVESEAADEAHLRLRLTETDGQVVYAHTFAGVQHDEDAIAREVSVALAQPYGVIQAHERAKDFGAGAETQYRCLLEAHEYWRNYDAPQYRRARDCLERMTEASPGFALGHAALAAMLVAEYRGADVRAGSAPVLQRALAAARRAVELKPASARAHQALADVQFARGDYPLALEAAERAAALNPYDPNILASYGGMLLSLGEQERGAGLIREAASALTVRPVWHDALLFLAAYLAGDTAGAARYAALIASDTYPPGLIARALAAAQRGDAEAARQLLDRLAAVRPGWRKDPRAELARYFPADAIVNRIERDIAQIEAIAGQ
jgi:tetratricopeptide (TPR) repeat protein